MGIEATAANQEGPAPSGREFLRVAEGQTLAAACAYLRDTGVRILGHNFVAGRWVIEVAPAVTQ